MKKLLILSLTVFLAATLGACGAKESGEAASDDFSYIQEKGSIVIGITEYEPMNYYDESGALVGFDTEFAEAACAKLGLTPEFQVINWETKETELNAKSIDCIWNGLTVDDERRQNMAFSDSYMRNEQVVVVRVADLDKYPDVASLDGAAVVAEEASAGETAVLADIEGAVYTAVASQAGALLEVKAGTANAAVVDFTMAGAMTGPGTDYEDLAVIEGAELTDEEYAIGFRLESSAAAEFNSVMAELMSDGTLAGIAEKYGVADRLIN